MKTISNGRAFRKKPVVIEAVQYTGDNLREVLDFTGKHPRFDEWFSSFEDYQRHVAADRQAFKIITLEGTMEALPGDWIIRGVKGEFYPCKPDIFVATYEPALSTVTPAEVGGLVDMLRSMSHDDNTRACVSVNITVSNDLAKKLFDVLHAAPKAAAALEAQAAELAAVKADKSDDAVAELFVAAWAEADKAMRKFPQPNYVISKVAEEAGEVVKAAIHCAEGRETPANVIAEIRQTMAMLLRLYVEGDQVHGLPPLKAAMEAGR